MTEFGRHERFIKPEFYLIRDGEFKVILEHIFLLVRKVKINPGVIVALTKVFVKTIEEYSINRVI